MPTKTDANVSFTPDLLVCAYLILGFEPLTQNITNIVLCAVNSYQTVCGIKKITKTIIFKWSNGLIYYGTNHSTYRVTVILGKTLNCVW